MKSKSSLIPDARRALLEKLKESLKSVLPVSFLVLLLSFTPWVTLTPRELGIFLGAAGLLIVGISLFNLGADLAMTPMGQYIGEGLTSSKKMGILLSVAFMMGLLITIAVQNNVGVVGGLLVIVDIVQMMMDA